MARVRPCGEESHPGRDQYSASFDIIPSLVH